MKLENATPFEIVWIPGRLRYPAHSLTVIVKGTFMLVPGGRVIVAEKQDPAGPDVESPEGAVYYESDFAHFKPRADRLLVGRCYVPGARPVRETAVAFTVGGWRRVLRVVGDRKWNRSLLKASAGDPEPFTTMDIGYARAFGGPRFAPNRAGRGFFRDKPESDVEQLLPNVEDPGQPVRTPGDAVAPAGFGPLSRTWAPRRGMIGTYGKHWFRTRCPWFPEDIDWGVNNAAPVPNQSATYLAGDEEIVLENLRSDAPRWAGMLPGTRVRAFADRRRNGTADIEEIALHLDTLWIDAEIGKLVLVWRGACDVASEEFEDLATLYVVSEVTASRKSTPAEVKARFAPGPRVEESAGPTSESAAVPHEEPRAPAAAGETAPAPRRTDDDEEEPEDEEPAPPMLDVLREQETYLDTLPDLPEVREAREAVAQAILLLERRPTIEPEPAPEPWSRERVLAAIEEGTPLAGADLSGLDLSEIPFRGASMPRASLDGCRLEHADLSGCDLLEASLSEVQATESVFDGASLRACRLPRGNFEKASLSGCDLADADLSGARLAGATLTGARAPRASFRDADLSRARADGAGFAGADLTGANATGARLTKARLDGAELAGASFRECRLAGASFEKARGRGCDFGSSDLTGASFVGADFSDAVFHASRGDRSVWTSAALDRARFTECDLDDADFTKASLESADFRGASLRRAIFRRARLDRALLSKANLFEALLPSARLVETDLRESNLFAADLSDVDARGANARGANVKRTRWDAE